ncbi:Protein CBG21839 [Caenorhabditis briggsae]|uniref:Protein CBG21839 n=1 Tax=Caenorhabditis briggsae TaxID=6238 RepID=A8Y0Y1_CAEBR|nr:Protein CBG21839 [Caenorhabditis briggsae]CAP38550.2 Protein CBG21839 [Caenorhabditis briggsae]
MPQSDNIEMNSFAVAISILGFISALFTCIMNIILLKTFMKPIVLHLLSHPLYLCLIFCQILFSSILQLRNFSVSRTLVRVEQLQNYSDVPLKHSWFIEQCEKETDRRVVL